MLNELIIKNSDAEIIEHHLFNDQGLIIEVTIYGNNIVKEKRELNYLYDGINERNYLSEQKIYHANSVDELILMHFMEFDIYGGITYEILYDGSGDVESEVNNSYDYKEVSEFMCSQVRIAYESSLQGLFTEILYAIQTMNDDYTEDSLETNKEAIQLAIDTVLSSPDFCDNIALVIC